MTKRKQPPIMPLTEEESELMQTIILENGPMLREAYGRDPHDDVEDAATFYAGVATGIGVAMKWLRK